MATSTAPSPWPKAGRSTGGHCLTPDTDDTKCVKHLVGERKQVGEGWAKDEVCGKWNSQPRHWRPAARRGIRSASEPTVSRIKNSQPSTGKGHTIGKQAEDQTEGLGAAPAWECAPATRLPAGRCPVPSTAARLEQGPAGGVLHCPSRVHTRACCCLCVTGVAVQGWLAGGSLTSGLASSSASKVAALACHCSQEAGTARAATQELKPVASAQAYLPGATCSAALPRCPGGRTGHWQEAAAYSLGDWLPRGGCRAASGDTSSSGCGEGVVRSTLVLEGLPCVSLRSLHPAEPLQTTVVDVG